MPLFDYVCLDCEKTSEILVKGSDDRPECQSCGSENLKKLFSAHSSMSGPSKFKMPGPGDTACCGSAPGQAAGCAGPGSCCGRN
ncbi:MAG: zinc ribbon domain-containing protein [Desulfobacterales bacterium]|nr:zinc ribbon domain-containing protein [Desulfobacterales bacterium]